MESCFDACGEPSLICVFIVAERIFVHAVACDEHDNLLELIQNLWDDRVDQVEPLLIRQPSDKGVGVFAAAV